QRREFSEANGSETTRNSAAQDMDGDLREMGSPDGQALTELLESDDRAALAVALESSAHAAGIARIRYLTQKNLYVREILNRMGLRDVQQEIDALLAAGAPDSTARARLLEERVDRLWDSARDFVERSLLLYARGETEQLRERLLKSARLANLDRHHLERMRVLVRTMAKRLATRYGRTRRRRLRG